MKKSCIKLFSLMEVAVLQMMIPESSIPIHIATYCEDDAVTLSWLLLNYLGLEVQRCEWR